MSGEITKHKDSNLPNKSMREGLEKLNKNLDTTSKVLGDIDIPRLFYQLVVFVIDGSKSMESHTMNKISKAEEIDKSIRLVMERLQASRDSNCFDISFVPFSEDFDYSFGIKNLKEISVNDSFNPFTYIKNPKETLIADAMKYIEEMVYDYLLKYADKNSQVLIQILSDGEISDYSAAEVIINRLKSKNKVTIACQYIEREIDENGQYYSWNESTGEYDESKMWTVEEVKQDDKQTAQKFGTLASSKDLFITSPDPDTIRSHMIKSITLVSKIKL